jgi:sec-independent protein translocase protein TatB
MFGMGWSEILLIGIVGVLVFGPDKLPEFVRQSARLIRTVRRMAQDAKDDLGRELGHDLSRLDLRDLDPREVVRRTILEDSPPAMPPAKEPETCHRWTLTRPEPAVAEGCLLHKRRKMPKLVRLGRVVLGHGELAFGAPRPKTSSDLWSAGRYCSDAQASTAANRSSTTSS